MQPQFQFPPPGLEIVQMDAESVEPAKDIVGASIGFNSECGRLGSTKVPQGFTLFCTEEI